MSHRDPSNSAFPEPGSQSLATMPAYFLNMISGDETQIYMFEGPSCLKASQTVHLNATKFQSVGKLPKCEESRTVGSTENFALEGRYNNI